MASLSYLMLMIEAFGFRKLEAAFASIIALMIIVFIILAGKAGADGTEVLRGLFVPSLPPGEITYLLVGGIVGGTISPYNFYLYSNLVVDRPLPSSSRGQKAILMKYFTLESAIAIFFALFMNVCIVCTFQQAFVGADYETIQAFTQGLFSAGVWLGQQFGQAFLYLYALGLFVNGLSSTSGSVLSGQIIMDGFVHLDVS